MSDQAPVPGIGDGSYDVFVVDVDDARDAPDAPDAPDRAEDDAVRLSLTILSGPEKGHVVELTARGLGRTSIDLIGMPGTLVVTDGEPRLTIDD